MKKSLPEVVCRSAFSWECPSCEHRNYGDLVAVDLQPDAFPDHLKDQVEAMRAEGMDAELEGFMMPNVVRCSDCGNRFAVREDQEL